MKGRRRIENETRTAIAKAWRERGLADLALLSLAAGMYHRGDSEESLVQMDAIVREIRERWKLTPTREREAWEAEQRLQQNFTDLGQSC